MMRRAFYLSLLMLLTVPTQAQNYLAPGFYDNTTPLITSAHYDIESSPAHYNGSAYLYDSTTGLSFYFYGQEFAVYGRRYSDAPASNVCVDSVCQEIDLYHASEVYGEMFRLQVGAAPDFHHITINRLDTGGVGDMVIDAVEIAPYPVTIGTPYVVVEVTQEPEPHVVEVPINEEQVGSFSFSMTAGDVMISLMVLGVLILSISQLMVTMLWKK